MPLGTQLVEKAGSLTCRPSKIKALLSSLKTLIQENPTQKVVIFSQVSPSRYYCSFATIADFFLSSLSTRVFASSAALGAVRCHHLTTPPLAGFGRLTPSAPHAGHRGGQAPVRGL